MTGRRAAEQDQLGHEMREDHDGDAGTGSDVKALNYALAGIGHVPGSY